MENRHGPLAGSEVDLAPLMHPRRVAVVGATDDEDRPDTAIWQQMAAWGEEVGAEVIPVNPRLAKLDGRPCFATITGVAASGTLDLVVVLSPDPLPVVTEAASIGARFAVVSSTGDAEVGTQSEAAEEGARQAELLEAIDGSGLRLLGPNTDLDVFEGFRSDLEGPGLALVTQSDPRDRPVSEAQEQGIRVVGWLPTGDEADLEVADGIEWFARQPDVAAIAVCAEGFKDGDRLRQALEIANDHQVPVVALEARRTEAAAGDAGSRTDALSDSDEVIDEVLHHHGVTRVADLDELLDCASRALGAEVD